MNDCASEAPGRAGLDPTNTKGKSVGNDEAESHATPQGNRAAERGGLHTTSPQSDGVPESDGVPQSDGVPGWRQHVLSNLRRGASAGAKAGERAAAELGQAAQAMALEIVPTGLRNDRALVGHVLGMHLALPASHLHGPREAPVLLYLFADALAIRPTDDAPMSTIPLFGLHMVLPPAAIAHWVYKAGRIEHANLDLVKDARRFADSLARWTVDDFEVADPKLEVCRTRDLTQPLRVYEHLGYAHLWVPPTDGRAVHLKSALPASSEVFVKLWQLFTLVEWPQGLSAEAAEEHAEPPGERAGEHADAHELEGEGNGESTAP